MANVTKICTAPWSAISLRNSNEISVCANSTFSFIVDKPSKLSEILNSQEFKNYRKQHRESSPLKTCDTCNTRAAHGLQTLRDNHNSLANFDSESRRSEMIRLEDVLHLDINLSNICNLKCRMCSFTRSSTWRDDQLELSKSLNFVVPPEPAKINIVDVDLNAFPNLKVLVLKGGEPFFDKSSVALLKNAVGAGVASKIHLTVFTNGVHIRKHLELLREFKRVNLFFSFEGTGSLYSYIRGGANTFEEFKANVLLTANNPNIYTRFMYTPQAYNIFDISSAVDFVWNEMNPQLFHKLSEDNLSSCFGNILVNPNYLALNVIPKELKNIAIEKIKKSNVGNLKIWKNILSFMDQSSSDDSFRKFLNFTKKLDHLRHENFFAAVPEFDLPIVGHLIDGL